MSLGVAALALSLTGPGRFFLDRLLGWRLSPPRLRVVPLLAAGTTATLIIVRRQRVLRTERETSAVDPHQPAAPDGSEAKPGSSPQRGPGAEEVQEGAVPPLT